MPHAPRAWAKESNPGCREIDMCEVCYVGEAMKAKIITFNAELHKVTKSPYGADDEIGMLHLIVAQSRSAILARAGAEFLAKQARS
jgi:hypothetical protein